ncbi:beta-glucoside-specific PTS transporter subunit IIABC [uncultured Martelella sp.]|uniref:beta-glucoside-specific PTS transporter subunit IIABC n=1 Tax=uncultured Martelella sp. TaxID=392331 RepID=UPI0029C84B45|nr:beta-glucoside-specific PTS transporter subunit IIABC [uncultured Martelella sp.]
MTQKYAPLAHEIIELVGGPQNVQSVYHCQTRLRFALRDEAAVKNAELNALDGVAATASSGGTFQVVIGTHVKDVFEEVDREMNDAGVEAQAPDMTVTPKHRNFLSVVIDFVSGTFQPIIPALSGAGMIMALLAVLVVFDVITTDSQTYRVLAFFSNAVFYFLPVFVAISAADKLKTSRIMAGVVAAMMLHPNWNAMVAAGEPVNLFGFIPLTLTTYGSTVIPILLIVFVQSYVERWLDRITPNAAKLVVVPMMTFLIMGTLAMALLGPIGSFLGGYLAIFFSFLTENAPWAPPVIIGSLLPIMVMFGIHNAIAPLGFAQLAAFGHESIFGPGALCSNIATGVAMLTVMLITKDAKTRQLATATGFTALMGPTEPALYGVSLPKRYPLIATLIGGGVGGLYAGLTATRRFAVGSSGLPAVVLYIGDNTTRYLVNILIALAITTVVTAVMTYLLSFYFEKRQTPAAAAAGAAPASPAAASAPAASLGAAATPAAATATPAATAAVAAPCNGAVIALSDVPDAAFSSGAMGPGVGVEPADGTIVAPVSGVVESAVDTGHAFGIVTEDGTEVLVHVGVDTVQMKGEGFAGAVPQGTRVVAGQTLVTADLAAIKAAGHPATVIVVVTNADAGAEISVADAGPVSAGADIITIKH